MKTDKIEHHLVIPDEYIDERLDQALAKLMPEYSRTQIQLWLEDGSIMINGKQQKGKTKVKGSEQVIITATVKEQPVWEAKAIPLNIVYEDDDILVINKPAGLTVHPGAGNANRTLLNALIYHYPALQTLPRAGIVHRIDKDTTGLLIVAKTANALKSLLHQLKKRTIAREYQAIVYGTMISGGTVDAPISRHPLQRKRMAVVETGKPAITHYRVSKKYYGITHLALKLESGRTHQIRVHMAHIRRPIVGDVVYGGRVQLSKGMSSELIQALREFKRQALHAFALEIEHPNSGEIMRWEAPLPDDMKNLILALEHDSVSRKK